MRVYPKMSQLLGACLLQCMPLFLQAQYPGSGYAPLVPNTVGASVAPLIPVEPVAPVVVPPPTTVVVPPPTVVTSPTTVVTPAPPSPQIIESPQPSLAPNAPLISERAQDILNFWFGVLPNPAIFPEDKLPIWFGGSPEIDRQIRERFSQDVLNAMRGEYNNWRETPKGRLALILLLDQFTRHIYGNTPQAFMSDRMARALVLEGLQKGDDRHLYPIERAFFYLPLEHSEDLQMQNLSVFYYQQLVAESPMLIKSKMQAFLQYAIKQRQQIARFGRFPHRNAILGRESTPEEVVFLNQWGRPSF